MGGIKTPLHLAAVCSLIFNNKCTTGVIKALVEAGADIKAKDQAGMTPWDYAQRNNQILDDENSDFHLLYGQMPSWAKCSKLCNAEWWETAETADLKKELDDGAAVIGQNNKGESPLHYAAGLGTPESIEVLLAAGAELLQKTVFGYTPLHVAATFRNDANIQALLVAGADVMARDINGNTPLHRASMYGNRESIQVLLAAGAEVMARNEDDGTPLHLAAALGGSVNIQALLTAGADAEAIDKNGKIPLDYARTTKAKRALAQPKNN